MREGMYHHLDFISWSNSLSGCPNTARGAFPYSCYSTSWYYAVGPFQSCNIQDQQSNSALAHDFPCTQLTSLHQIQRRLLNHIFTFLYLYKTTNIIPTFHIQRTTVQLSVADLDLATTQNPPTKQGLAATECIRGVAQRCRSGICARFERRDPDRDVLIQ